MSFRRVGDIAVMWGESLRWDDRRQRLYFVDCATQTLHWLEQGVPPVASMKLPSMPTGMALTEGGQLVACLDDGLHIVDPDGGSSELLSAYPAGMHGRANDGCADGAGNFVTGTLNLTAGRGALWWYSVSGGWRLLEEGFGNANGPAVMDMDGQPTLIFADTLAGHVYAYPYDAKAGTVGERRLFADHAGLDGAPDGGTSDAAGGYWSCVLRSGKVARVTGAGSDRVIDMPMANPSDVAFGGAGLDVLFVTSIALDLGEGRPVAAEAGWLLAIDDMGPGRPEPRVAID